MNNFLFEEFEPVTAKQWKQKIQLELKGADYNKTLLSNTNEGISIKPFYHGDVYKQLDVPKNQSDFKICQTIYVNNEKTSNYLAVNALKKGADFIKFIANKTFDFEILLKDLFMVNSKKREIHFQLHFLSEDFTSELIDFAKDQTIYLNIDLIGNLEQTGNWYYDHNRDHDILRSILKKTKNNIGILGVDASLYQNSGANMVQQVAYTLAHANEYLNFLFKLKKDNELQDSNFKELVKNMQFTFAVGGNYFFEIAKLRSFRYLWDLLLQEYELNADANIFVEPSIRNKTLYDYNVNMLRTATETMSAIIGGANVISNISYDTFFHKKNDFGERISRNQLIILKEESNIRNAEFAEGSYYIEQLTAEISEKALLLFKDIEKSGGLVKQLFEGTIQRKIKESAQKEQEQFDSGKLVLLGINKHPNKDDKMKNDLELYPFVKAKNHETLINPILAKRLAEKSEKRRVEEE